MRAVEQALSHKSYHSALALSLALPDICGKISQPTVGSQSRYTAWFEKYVQPKYTARVGAGGQEHIFLGGSDCYALRCAFLHEGTADISNQRAAQALENFTFVVSPIGSHIHCNQSNNSLQLDLPTFCADIIQGVREWASEGHPIPFNLLDVKILNLAKGFAI